jgi:hypothetical protein
VRETGVQRVIDALALLAARDLKLVLDPRAVGQLQDDVPQVGAAQPPQRHALGQPKDLVHQVDLAGLAPVEEGAPGALDNRYLLPREEAVNDGRLDGPALPEPVDG